MAVNLHDTDCLLQNPMENMADKSDEGETIGAFGVSRDITFHNPM